MHSIRPPAVAGRFYPADPAELKADLTAYLSQSDAARTPTRACIVPHAGYMYSGHVAGAVFSRLQIPNTTIILCPNHTGVGHPLAIMSEGAWRTPLGKIPIDASLANSLKQNFPALTEDSTAHRAEHAIEVELPFLQFLQPGLTFVPITVGTRNFDILEQLGQAIAATIAAHAEPVLLISSSDMNHYESDVITRGKDIQAIERILQLDPRGLYDTVMQQQISMCGLSPTVATLVAARALGATAADLIKYATSGDISGDRDRVVGYAGIVVP